MSDRDSRQKWVKAIASQAKFMPSGRTNRKYVPKPLPKVGEIKNSAVASDIVSYFAAKAAERGGNAGSAPPERAHAKNIFWNSKEQRFAEKEVDEDELSKQEEIIARKVTQTLKIEFHK